MLLDIASFVNSYEKLIMLASLSRCSLHAMRETNSINLKERNGLPLQPKWYSIYSSTYLLSTLSFLINNTEDLINIDALPEYIENINFEKFLLVSQFGYLCFQNMKIFGCPISSKLYVSVVRISFFFCFQRK